MGDNLEDSEIQQSALSLQPKGHQLSVNQTISQIKKNTSKQSLLSDKSKFQSSLKEIPNIKLESMIRMFRFVLDDEIQANLILNKSSYFYFTFKNRR